MFLNNLVALIIQPLVNLLFALAVVYFLFGASKFILNAADSKGREDGKQALIWGLVGLFIMSAVWGILGVLTKTFGI